VTEAEFFKTLLSSGSSPILIIGYLAWQGHRWYTGMTEKLTQLTEKLTQLEKAYERHQSQCDKRFCTLEQCVREVNSTKSLIEAVDTASRKMQRIETDSRRITKTPRAGRL
jgi:hypothetical protein